MSKVDLQKLSTIENMALSKTTIAGSVTFIKNEKFIKEALENPNIIAIITTPQIEHQFKTSKQYIVTNNPSDLFYKTYLKWCENFLDQENRISAKASIHPTAVYADKNVVIEDDVIIEANIVINEKVRIAKGSIIKSNCTIGKHGFEVKNIENKVKMIPHNGWVKIGRKVVIQDNSCIDNGIYGEDTIIMDETVIGAMCLVSHNNVIGKKCLIAPGCVISGNVVIGDKVWMGLGAKILNRIRIGDNAHVGIGSLVTRNIENDEKVMCHTKLIKIPSFGS